MDFIKANQTKILQAVIILLFAGFSFLLLYRLGVHPFIDWDESIYAQVAKESLQNRSFFDLTYFERAWYEKPPLGFWLVSIAYAIGGINDWTARIPSALASISIVALSLRWVWELRKSYTAVILTAASYFIMFPFITSSYFLNLDTIVGLFALLSLYSWWKAANNHKWYLIWGLAIGLGVMTKNVVGLFPLAPILILSVINWDFAFLKARKFWYGVLIVILTVVPWHLYQSLVAGQAFWDNYLFYHVLQRYSTSLEYNGAPFLYYFELVFQRYYIATLIFGGSVIAGLYFSWKDIKLRFVLLSAIVLFLVFSSSTTKIYSYITMTLPLLVVVSGMVWAKIIELVPKTWMRVVVTSVLICTFVYTGYAFNTYKLAQGEYAEEYLDNKAVGEFLRNYRTDLPVYTNFPYINLAIGYYADRKVNITPSEELIPAATEMIFRRRSQSVFLGDGYIVIKR